MPSPFSIRAYHSSDRAALRDIAWETGLLGQPANGVMPDRELFADLFTSAYTDEDLGPRLVAELDGLVVGYIVGSLHPSRAGAAYRRVALRVARGLALRRYPRWLECLPYLEATVFERKPRAPESAFPAQLHVNLRPQARGQGAGGRLLDTFLGETRASGASGVQLSTTTENLAALGLYTRRGFVEHSRLPSPLFTRLAGRPVARLVLTLHLR